MSLPLLSPSWFFHQHFVIYGYRSWACFSKIIPKYFFFCSENKWYCVLNFGFLMFIIRIYKWYECFCVFVLYLQPNWNSLIYFISSRSFFHRFFWNFLFRDQSSASGVVFYLSFSELYASYFLFLPCCAYEDSWYYVEQEWRIDVVFLFLVLEGKHSVFYLSLSMMLVVGCCCCCFNRWSLSSLSRWSLSISSFLSF